MDGCCNITSGDLTRFWVPDYFLGLPRTLSDRHVVLFVFKIIFTVVFMKAFSPTRN